MIQIRAGPFSPHFATMSDSEESVVGVKLSPDEFEPGSDQRERLRFKFVPAHFHPTSRR